MKKLLALILSITTAVSACGCASMVGVKDDSSSNLNGNLKIASTSVAICEILNDLDYDNVIGIPETSTGKIPERYKNTATIGAPMTPDYEKIKDLAPDMVLSPKSLENTLSADYSKAGINSAFLDLSSVDGMYSAIDSLGGLLGRQEKAKELRGKYEAYMKSYKSKDDAPNILLLMAFPDGFYLVCTERCYVGNLVKLAGGNNVYSADTPGADNGFVTINPEDIVQKKPEKILIFAHYNEDSAFEYMKNEIKTNKAWSYFDAVKNNEVYYLPSKYFSMSASLSWYDALDYLKPVLYGE